MKYKLDVVTAGKNFTQIRKAIAAGFFSMQQERIHKKVIELCSALFQRQLGWVIYHEMILQSGRSNKNEQKQGVFDFR
ncbi:hypothetical protein CsSME_00024796 [Camellia sinensis var. sinensis]